MRFRECMSKNAGVAGYVKAFWHVLSESQTGQCINYLLFAVLDALAEARQRDLSDSFVLSGTSAKFSIAFDLSWKVMKDILVQYYSITGFVTGSPREVLRESFKAKLISDDAWMDMLKVRNELAHDYDCEVVRTHCNTIVEKYIDLFYDFKNTIDELLKVG